MQSSWGLCPPEIEVGLKCAPLIFPFLFYLRFSGQTVCVFCRFFSVSKIKPRAEMFIMLLTVQILLCFFFSNTSLTVYNYHILWISPTCQILPSAITVHSILVKKKVQRCDCNYCIWGCHAVICFKENTYESTYHLESVGQMDCCVKVCIFRFDSA